MFRRILCATDFSDTAEAAWEMACELSRVHRAELVLVHVFDLPLYSYAEVPGPAVQKVWEEQQQWVRRALDERVATATAHGLRARALLKLGAPASGIAEAAGEEGADLVVAGTHGRTGFFDRLVIGSVAERIVRIAPCPVLTVKPRPDPQQARAAA